MILIQHVDARERHKYQVEEAAQKRHKVVCVTDFEEVIDLSSTEILFTFGKGVSIDTLTQMPNLKWIQLCSTGFDHMPKEYLLDKGIIVTTVKGVHAEPIAEYAFSCMLYFSRKMDRFLQLQKEKKWYRFDYPSELMNKTVVIVGTGNIGKAIAKRAHAFSMQIIGVNQSGRQSDYFKTVYPIGQLECVLPKADYLILAIPLTNQTNDLIRGKQISLLKQSAVVINVGRGEIMDEPAAREMLLTKKIRGMALDVFCQEPLPADSPLWDVEGLLITPHMAAKTDRFLDRSIERFIENYYLYIDDKKLKDMADFTKGY